MEETPKKIMGSQLIVINDGVYLGELWFHSASWCKDCVEIKHYIDILLKDGYLSKNSVFYESLDWLTKDGDPNKPKKIPLFSYRKFDYSEPGRIRLKDVEYLQTKNITELLNFLYDEKTVKSINSRVDFLESLG